MIRRESLANRLPSGQMDWRSFGFRALSMVYYVHVLQFVYIGRRCVLHAHGRDYKDHQNGCGHSTDLLAIGHAAIALG